MASLSALVVAKREPAPAPAAPPAPPQARRRRNQPGNPSPDAEVVALSPTTLMATNRFICEVCNKGFQREQNLQLHRRGHNLPWKLKQRSTTAPRRKVYLCPEPNCIHHHPTRALGDLTGIKKHYSRKHGEKKFKCEKCAKKYAVQSDWKAHMKTCGTREYRCDCGTLFSRRDSFITHRAFCDALAQETAGRTTFVGLGTGLFSGGSTNMLSHSSHQQIAGATAPSAFRSLLASSSSTYRPHMGASSSFFQLPETQDFRLKAVVPPLMHGGGHGLPSHSGGSSAGAAQPGVFNMSHSGGSSSGAAALAPGMFNYGSYFPSNNRSNSGGDSGGGDSSSNVTFPMSGHFNITNQFSDGGSSFFAAAAPPHLVGGHMSATALLQQAAMIGSTSSTISASLLRTFNSHPAKLEHGHHQLYSQDYSPFGSILDPQSTYYPPSYANVGPPPGFGSLRRSSSSERGGASSSSRLNVVGEGLTRDFLGMRAAAAAASGGGETSGGAADRKDVRAPPVKGVGGIRFKQ